MLPFPDDFAAELPAPRDDEPPDLRRRIVAELRDHLQSAYHRELVRSGDETEAARRVQKTFGNPARLARKLWFDAMQEKIMSQRIVVGISALLAFACLGTGGYALHIAQRTAEQSAAASRALLEKAQAANQLLLEQGRDLNAALIERLSHRDSATESGNVPERTRFKIRLVQGTNDGPPAAGSCVFLGEDEGHPLGLMKGNLVDYSTTEGLVDCGLLLSGSYWLSVTTPGGIGMVCQIYVRLGESEQTETVICPIDDDREREVAIAVNWPADLRARRMGVILEYSAPPSVINGRHWQFGGGHDGRRGSLDPVRLQARWGRLLVTTDGVVSRIHDFSISGNTTRGAKRSFANGLADGEKLSELRLKGTTHTWQIEGVVFPSDPPTGEFGSQCPYVTSPSKFSNDRRVEQRLADNETTTVPVSFSDELLTAVRAALRDADPTAEFSD